MTSWSQDNQCSFTQLNMAFPSDEPSNIFDGPMALTKERDACGVGFIANTKAGGKFAISRAVFFYHFKFQLETNMSCKLSLQVN